MKKFTIICLLAVASIPSFSQPTRVAQRPESYAERLNNEYCTGLFQSAEGQIFDIADNLTTGGYLNILDWLDGRVAGLQVRKTWSGQSIPFIRGTLAGIYVDEMPIQYNFLNSLNIFDIAIVKVVKSPFMGGFNGGGGAILIYTKGGEEEDEESVD